MSMLLRIAPRSAAVTIGADPTLDRPYRLSWRGPLGRLRGLGVRGSLDVALDPSVEWALRVDGGVAGLRADLRDLRVEEVAIDGGAADIELDLPRPAGLLPVTIAGGVNRAAVRRPAGVALSLAIDGGATGLRVDGVEHGPRGGGLLERLAGEGDEIALHVRGGASGLAVEREPLGGAPVYMNALREAA